MVMKKLHLYVVSPEHTWFNGEVEKVTLPGVKGSFSILPRHAPIVSALKAGTLSYVTNEDKEHTLEILGGFVEMSDEKVSVCVECPND